MPAIGSLPNVSRNRAANGHGNNYSTIGVRCIKTLNTKEMNVNILKGYDGVRIWANLSVGSLEPECLVESDRFVEVAAW
jgi:hypothetical protein